MNEYSDIDVLDRAILDVLQREGRMTNVDLARLVNLSPPAVHTRVKRLEQQGYIRGYVALLDAEKLGYDMLCFVSVTLAIHQPEHVENFREVVQRMPEVLACHHITGAYDYLLKVVVANRKALERFVMTKLTPIPGIAHIQTSLVLREIKNTTQLPVEEVGDNYD